MAKNYEKNNYSENYTRHLVRGNVTGNLGINSALRFSAVYGEGVDRLQVLRKIEKENRFRFWWYLVFGLCSIACLIWQPAGWLSVLEVFVLMVNIDLVARGKVSGLYVAIFDCLLYIAICSISGLWGEVIKMVAIFIPLNILGIVNWTKNIKAQRKNKHESSSIQIRRLGAKGWLICAILLVVLAVAGYFFLKLLNTTSLIISSISFSIGIIYKYLSGQRYMEGYVISMVSNIISLALWITTFVSSGNPTAMVQIVAMLACMTDGIYGFILWNGMYRKEKINGGKILSKRKMNIKRVIKLRRMYKSLYWNQATDITKNS